MRNALGNSSSLRRTHGLLCLWAAVLLGFSAALFIYYLLGGWGLGEDKDLGAHTLAGAQ